MRTLLAIILAFLAAGCASDGLDPVFDGGVYDPVFGAAEAPAETG